METAIKRFGVMSLLVAASVLGGIALTDTASAQSLSIEEMTTTKGEELTDGSNFGKAAVAEGQDIEITVGYQSIPASPSNPQTIKVVDDDTVTADDELASTTVTNRNGEVTLRIPYERIPNELGGAIFDDIGFAYVNTEVKWVSGGETKESVVMGDEFGIEEEPTTIYVDGDTLPDSVNDGEDVTVDFYGWSEDDSVFPTLLTASGNQIGGPFSEQNPNPSFSGSISFTPSKHVAVGETLDIQMHTQDEDGPKSNVESISVASGPDASIDSVSQQSGTFTTGDDVSATVTITNTGQQGNTFFVGYSAVSPNGDFFDNQNTTGKTVTLSPGETKTLTVEWTVQSEAPLGDYDTIVSVWEESDRTNLQTRLDTVRKQDAFTVASNQQPTASFTVTPNNPDVGETVTFDASDSNDPDGSIQSYEWDFGDDGNGNGGSPPVPGQSVSTTSTGTGEQTTHSYDESRTYTVELTVTDDDEATDTTTRTVSVGNVGGSLSPNNPFGGANDQPLGISDAADVLFQWNQPPEGEVNGRQISKGDMANFLFEWNQAR